MANKNSIFLCGGGALGAWQSGVFYRLVKEGIFFDKVCGFSIGAINGAFYCFNMLDKAERLWSLISNKKVFKFSLSYSKPVLLFDPSNYSFFKKFIVNLENIFAGIGVYSGTKVKNLLSRYITKNLVFNENVDFYCISHCVEYSQPYIKLFNSNNYSREEFINHVLASSSIPFIFPAVKIDEFGKTIHLVDGGVIGRKYINLDFLSSSKNIFVISNVCEKDKYFKPNFNLIDLFEYRVRRILLYQNVILLRCLKNLSSKPNIIFISPPSSLDGRILDFDGEKCSRLFKEGFRYALNLSDSFKQWIL